MQPYMNPNYFNQYQMPMYQQQPSNQTRIVSNFNEIQANEIPMDGSYKLFAKSDMSEIQARTWTPQGTISVLEYSLKQPIPNNNVDNVAPIEQKDLYEPILTEIKALSDKIDKLTRPAKRKEVQDNES